MSGEDREEEGTESGDSICEEGRSSETGDGNDVWSGWSGCKATELFGRRRVTMSAE